MGPPPFGERNSISSTCCWRPTSSFNGAAAFRRAEFAISKPSANGLSLCFNGAAAFRRAEFHQAGVNEVVVPAASMGPPPFGERNGPDRPSTGRHTHRFNGAAAFRRAELVALAAHLRDAKRFNGAAAFRRAESGSTGRCAQNSVSLQWGRRLSASGICRTWRPSGRETLASMGPPPFGERNAIVIIGPASIYTSFNGAAAFRRAEFFIWTRIQVAMFGFNGAAAFRRAECPDACSGPCGQGWASMGPPPFGERNHGGVERVHHL